MKKSYILFYIVLFFLASCQTKKEGPAIYVDPFIGTGGHGHTFPGVVVPNGMVQLSPDQRTDGWDWCSGYHYSDNSIIGFSHTHLSGTGVGDMGDILLMPTVGNPVFNPGSIENPDDGYRSRFSHDNETAEAGYYQVFLDDYKINAELTATSHAGMHRYTFPKSDKSNIIIDLHHGIKDQPVELRLSVVSDTEVAGLRRSKGWANNQYVYFVARFSKPFSKYGIVMNGEVIEGETNAESQEDIKAYVQFETGSDEEIVVKVGISPVSIEGAKKNLDAEIAEFDFDEVRKSAFEAWNKELNKIKIETKNETDKRIFYTALYHTMIHPTLYTDVDGRYRGRDMQIHDTNDFTNYTVFSLWDTFRGAHPLYTIISPDKVKDYLQTFEKQYEQDGRLPVWELTACETECMIGYHSVSVIADAYAKGIASLEDTELLDAMTNNATLPHFGLESYMKNGYVKVEDEGESVSKTLEYAYDDWCIAKVAKLKGREDIYNQFIERAQYYKNVYDPKTGFMRGKINSTWSNPFDPREVNFNYTEANAWQYTFFVPHDITGLIELMGGKDKFVKKLDLLFTEKAETTGREQADITGLIGQYAHGNEPSHHKSYLYNYAGEAWKTQMRVNQILRSMYTDEPDGYSGNEDCGQMSAWYVLSAMGFYQVTPGTDMYIIGSPLFDKATINIPNGKIFTITANNLSAKNIYIQSVKLNGKDYSKSYLIHADIVSGGELIFEMGAQPNKKWGAGEGNYPVSDIKDEKFLAVPFMEVESRTFYDELQIGLSSVNTDALLYYTTDGTTPTSESHLYTEPFVVNETTKINAIAINNENKSKVMQAEVFKIPEGRKITLNSEYSPQYTAGGDIGLIDYMRGTANFKTGFWQGYSGQNIEAIVELGKAMKISKIETAFIQDEYSWIFMPDSVAYFVSDDGNSFKKVDVIENDIPKKESGPIVKQFTSEPGVKAKFVKMIAYTTGKCPEWHKSAGDDSWLFIDEIVIE